MKLELLKQLRDMTGAGVLDCKDALKESSGNLDEAVTLLRKKGIAKSLKKSDREVKEGRIIALLSKDSKKGVLLEINCETDFVSRNEVFVDLTQNVANLVLEGGGNDFDDCGFLKEGDLKDKINKMIQETVVSLGESLRFSRAVCFKSSGILSSYVHLGDKIGVLLDMDSNVTIDKSILKDICMHIVAAHPLYLKEKDIPQSELEREREIILEQNRNKPPQFLEKIIAGKMKKYFSDVCLMNQAFIKDPSQSVQGLLNGSKISRFIRFELSN